MTTRPNFFIVGAPKCGTTALSEYLKQHPNIFMCSPKEPHYFATDMPKKRLVSSEHEYLQLFNMAGNNHTVIGEASVWYLYSHDAIDNIKQFAPESKIIAMLRDPVDLVYSMHSQALYTRNEDEKNFSRAWDLIPQRKKGLRIPKDCKEIKLLFYDEIALLGSQLERLLGIFPKQQVMVIFFDDFIRDIRHVYKDVLAFLDLPDDQRENFPVINANKRHRLHWLSKLTRRPPHKLVKGAKLFKQLFGIERLGLSETIERYNRTSEKRPELDGVTRSRIIKAYRSDIDKLSKITGRDLSSWAKSG